MGKLLQLKDFGRTEVEKFGTHYSRANSSEKIGDVVHLGDFERTNIKRFRVHYEYADYSNPTDLLADFVDKLETFPIGSCSADQSGGDYTICLGESSDVEDCAYANFAYHGVYFEVFETHPRAKEISDLFVKHLADKKVPWELYEEVSVLDRRCD